MGEYLFDNPVPDSAVYVDDEPLAEAVVGSSLLLWQPRFFAGEVRAEVVRGGDSSVAAVFLLDVSPDPKKVGREFFDDMLRELWATNPSLVVGSEPATNPIGDLGAFEEPWLAFSRLRRYAPEFLRAIRPIIERPRRTLRVHRRSQSMQHVQHVDRQTALAALRTPAAGLFFSGQTDAAVTPTDFRLDVPVSEESVDSAANRAILALVTAIERRTQQVKARLHHQVAGEHESDTRTALAKRWPARGKFLDGLSTILRQIRLRPPFDSVRRSEITAAGLNAVSADSAYSRAWNRGWHALRRGLENSDPGERLWISPSWEIYERWCFVRLAQILQSALPDWKWRKASDSRTWTGRLQDRLIELSLQPTFRAYDTATGSLKSLSKQRVPDILLTLQSGDATRLAIVDAKYRVSRENVLDAMESAHVYHDSLRTGSRRPESCLIFVPAGGGAPWLEDPAFHLEHGVGVQPFSRASAVSLPKALAAFLGVC